ncbi:MAG: 50S ribosomal protein L3 [Candidatus Woesearchaeota archaeon]
MAKISVPRHGSMQYWPRKRAKSIIARVRSWAIDNNTKPLGFAGYKAGMTHVICANNRSSKPKSGDTFFPVTIIECPPLKAASLRFYKKTPYGLKILCEIYSQNLDKELSRKIKIKESKNKIDDIKDFDDIRLLVYTQPKLTSLSNKKPELFEMGIGGKKEDKLKFAKEKLGKEIDISEIFKEGMQVDIHSITKGKGNQGPIKRFGVGLRSHKAEKTKRGPGSLGPWRGQGHVMYRVAHAGQMGYFTRTESNKQILKIGDNPEKIKIKGGIPHFGFVKNKYVLIKGSVAGPKKRLIKLTIARHPNKKIPKEAPTIKYTSLESKQ